MRLSRRSRALFLRLDIVKIPLAYQNDNEVATNLSGPGIMRNNTAYGPSGSSFSFSATPGSEVSNNQVVVV